MNAPTQEGFPMPRTLMCWLKIAVAVFLVVLTTALAVRLAHADDGAYPGRSPVAVAAEKGFFQAFNGGAPADRSAPLRLLMAAYATDPNDSRTNLLLGLNHLWMAAEGGRTDPRVIADLMLADRFLARAQTLDPLDQRIPSWRVPVRMSLAQIEREPARQKEIVGELLAAYEKSPNFHSFTVALLGFGNPKDAPEFQRGLAVLDRVKGCGAEEAACQDLPRWPHNREGFITFHADYELKAGHPDRAAELLRKAQAEPGYASWPFRGEVEDRLKNLDRYAGLYADADPGNDPPMLMASEKGTVCQTCHRAQ
jgi:hypothetical protein